jgi:hypothetical protein
MLLVDVTSVEVLGHYRLLLGFSDGSTREIDLTGELHGPIFEPLADPDFFNQVRVDPELGTIVWPNGADLDPLVLHGDFEPASRMVRR